MTKELVVRTTIFTLLLTAFFAFSGSAIYAQTTEFSYQGSLKDGANPANGNYDFEFLLFDNLAAGSQIGLALARNNVAVTDGTFSVKLDFGNQFPGAGRFLEIRVRQTGGGEFTLLAPRQMVNSAPYSVKSINAENATNAATATNSLQLGGVAANQYVLTGDARLTDARTPTAGSTNYVQNTTTQQTTSNFNISGNGTAGGTLTGNIVDAGAYYSIGGNRVLSISGTNNIFAGLSAGFNSTGNSNSFFGHQSGSRNTTGIGNSFFGSSAGSSNRTGTGNTIIGQNANVGSSDLSEATAIGAGAIVLQSNSLVLGNNANVGIGTSAPNHLLTVGPTEAPVIANARLGVYSPGASYSIVRDTTNDVEGLFGVDIGGVIYGSMTNHKLTLKTNNTNRVIIASTGEVSVFTLGVNGSIPLCRNASDQISFCSSSLKYKTNIDKFSSGLSFLKKLRPISFDWIDGGMKDVGFGAEEIAKIDPRFVTYNAKGEVEGVKYDRVGVVLVNAVNEQQAQIEAQQKTIDAQQKQIDELKLIVCQISPTAYACQK